MGSAPSNEGTPARPKPQRPITPARYVQMKVKAREEAAIIPDVAAGHPNAIEEEEQPVANPPATIAGVLGTDKFNEPSMEDSSETQPLSGSSKETLPAPDTKLRVVLFYHSKDETIAKSVENELKRTQLTDLVVMVSETGTLEYRESIVQWADIVVLVVSYKFQQNSHCQEITNYSKDTKKKVLMVAVQPNYDPTGVVGAVGKAYGEIVLMSKGEPLTNVGEKLKKIASQMECRSFSQPPKELDNTKNVNSSKSVGNDNTLYISFADGPSAKISEMVRNGRGIKNGDKEPRTMNSFIVIMGVQDSPDMERIKSCRVFIPVLSESFQSSKISQQQFELARELGKNILPVKAEKFTPSGWLALAMAGKLFYEMKNETDAYNTNKNISDTNRMNDFISSVVANLANKTDEYDREQTIKNQLVKECDEIKPKLKEWPPKDSGPALKLPPYPDKTELLPKEENAFDEKIILYTMTRIDFVPLYDGLGLPIDKTFDCMISYQWDVQFLVQKLVMQLDQCSVKVWYDMRGGMVGNVNDAMARAVEASVSVTVFLTNNYQKSVNCMFELKYALALDKPLIFIIAETKFEPLEWIKTLMNKFLVLTITTEGEIGKRVIKNYPNLVILSDAMRKLSEWKAKQIKPLPCDVSEEIYELQKTLENAKIAMYAQQGSSRFLTCSRCKGQYEESNKKGCKKHSGYYMGGSLMSARWWCCNQSNIDSLGCDPADHINQERVFGGMPGYPGCKQWTPA